MTPINHLTLLDAGFTQFHVNHNETIYTLDIDAEIANFYISINFREKGAKLYYQEQPSQTVHSIEDIAKTSKDLTGITI